MAKSKKKRRTKKKTGAKRKSNQIPLKVLNKRLISLNAVVKRRGGNAF